MLCHACNSIFKGKGKVTSASGEDWKAEVHHQTVLNFQKSASQGCRVCASLWTRFSEDLEVVDLSTLDRADEDGLLTRNLSRRDQAIGLYTVDNLILFFSLNAGPQFARHVTFANFMVQPLRGTLGPHADHERF